MHTFFLFVAYLSATLATPVAQLFDFFEDDTAATINNNQGIKILPQDFGTGEPEDLSTGLQQVGGNDAPSFLTGSATINYLQAQVPSQDTFSNSGGGCPSGELFCCRGGSGPAGSLFTDDAFNDKCIPYNDENAGDEKCQVESNGSCCQSKTAAGVPKVWQCVSTPIKVVPAAQEGPENQPQTQPPREDPDKSAGRNRPILPAGTYRAPKLLNYGKGNWESL